MAERESNGTQERGSGQFLRRAQRYLLAGILTIIPLWITWLVFEFFLRQLYHAGRPWVRAIADEAQRFAPFLGRWLLEPWFQSILAVILTLVALYLLGWAASRVIGRRVLNLFDQVMDRIPFVHTVYGSTKRLLAALQQKPGHVQRVVLIEFPSPEMKAVGFVTQVVKDRHTGQELASVYVPTTPNPTSGYVEIVPVERLVNTDWTMDEAMNFIISGGAVSPKEMNYSRNATSLEAEDDKPPEQK